ncbi:MAG: aminopeptidase P N-terminal domain-containing protein, partial [Polyangiaceae bacterium]
MHDREARIQRRAAFFDSMAKSASPGEGLPVAVVPSAPVFIRNNDVEHEYRQDSDFFYLTGFDEPDSVVVLDAQTRRLTLFVRPRDPAREVWDGPRAGVDGAKAEFGADEAFTIDKLEAELPKLLSNRRRLYYRLGRDRSFDD